MSDELLLKIILPISILAQLTAAILAVRLIRFTGKSIAWSLIAIALVLMTARRVALFSLLISGDATEVSLASESLGLPISLLLLSGVTMLGSILRNIQLSRKKMEADARRLQDASTAGRVALWEWDVLTGTREWSSLVDDMLGYPPNGFPRSYRVWESRIHPDDLAGVQDAIRSNFETNAPYDVTYRIQCADNSYAWWHEVGHVNRDRDGAPVALSGASVDITERKQREEEHSAIFQAAMDGVLIISARTGRLLDVNEAYCRLTGYTRAELLSMRLADLDAQESAGAVSARLLHMDRFGHDRYETRHRCKDGRTVDLSISIQNLATSNRLCAFVSDITASKQHESVLRTRLADIERFNQLTIAREQRMVALKQEVNQLAHDLARPAPYTSLTDDTVLGPMLAAPVETSTPADLPLHELLDIRKLQPLLDGLSVAAGVSAAIIDARGELLVGANWQPICTAFHRVHERSWTRCMESETEQCVKQYNAGKGYALYACHNGLQMAAAPILVDHHAVGHLFLSQFLLAPPDLTAFQKQAAEFGFPEKAYLAALAHIPVLPEAKLTLLLELLTGHASLLSQLSEERLHERQQETTTQHTHAELQHQREAALNLAQDSIESRRLLETSQNALQQNRDMLEHILNSIPHYVFWKDRAGTYLGCNQLFANANQLTSPQDVVGKTDFELPENRAYAETYRADDRHVMENSRHRSHIVEPVQKLNGTQIWVDKTKIPLIDRNGQIYGVLGVYEDITERKQAEEQIRKREARHHFALETLRAGEWELDLASLTAERSEQHARIFGYAPPLQPWSLQDLLRHIVPDDLEHVEHSIREAIRLGRDLDFECRIIRRDEVRRWIWVRGRHTQNAQGRDARLAGIVIDITERKREEDLMRQSREHLQLALIAIEDAVWDWAPANKRLFWSPRLFSMLGYAPDEFTPTIEIWESLLHPEDKTAAQALLQQCMTGQRNDYLVDVRLRTKDGAWRWVGVRGRVLSRGAHGEILRMAGTHTDISDRKNAEAMIRQQLEELQRWQTVMLGREQRALELKHEVNALLLRLKEPIRYPSAEEGAAPATPSTPDTKHSAARS